MKWYKFWKKSGPNQGLTEDYIEVNDDWYPDTKSVRDLCESWAETVGGGFNTHYSYGFEEIKFPPKDWLIKKIKDKNNKILYAQKDIKRYKDILNKIKNEN